MKFKVRLWIIYKDYKEFTPYSNPYILDANKLDVSEEELALNIQEQIYGVNVNTKSSKGEQNE